MTCKRMDFEGKSMIVCADGLEPSAEDLARVGDVLRVTDGGGTMAEARVVAGLSVGQAAKLLGVTRTHLVAVETGESRDDLLRRRMLKVYGVAGFAGDRQ